MSDKEAVITACLIDKFTEFCGKATEMFNRIFRKGLLSDREIKALCGDKGEDGMIFPYFGQSVKLDEAGRAIFSYGQSSYGYDVRSAPKFYIFTNINSLVVDPKKMDTRAFAVVEGKSCIIPPNSFILCRTMEYFKMPKDVTGVVLGKSSLARVGLICLATPLEAGWEGELVLEFANTTPLPMMFYAEEGCAQILFFRGNQCMTNYADRKGKYHGQRDITLARLDREHEEAVFAPRTHADS